MAQMQAELSALKEDAAFRRGREELLREQGETRRQSQAIWIPAVLSVLSLLVAILSLLVAINK